MNDSLKTVRTMTELAKVFNVSQPRISQWKKMGMPVESDGTYSIQKITNWRLSRVSEKVQALVPATLEKDELQVVDEIVSQLGRFRELVNDFKKDRGDILCGVEAKLLSVAEDLLSTISRNEILAISPRDRLRLVKDLVASLSSLYTSERVERGESTENIAIINKILDEARERMGDVND
jgi:hypothetical protein